MIAIIIICVLYFSYILIARFPFLIVVPIYLFVMMTPVGKAVEEYESFWAIKHNIGRKFSNLIDPDDYDPIIMYRMKQPAISATRTIFCRSIIYKLNPEYKKYLSENTENIYKIGSFKDFNYIGDCIGQLNKYDSKSKFLAPFLSRISKGNGSYIVYGSTKNINLANKFHSASSTIEKYAVAPKVFDGNRYNQYFILVDEQEKMVKIIHNYNYCGFVCN